jgi:DNA-directed RNA polymerase specialized sigma24 family protein
LSQRRLPPFETRLERYGRPLLRFCVARLRPDGGEDAFQETLLTALANYDQSRSPEAARSWLLSIAHSKIVDATRRRSREAPATDQEPADTWVVSTSEVGIWGDAKDLPPKQREAACGFSEISPTPRSARSWAPLSRRHDATSTKDSTTSDGGSTHDHYL